MTMPSVSVVMSVYKHPEQVQMTIDSVLAQRQVDWELIVVDDGAEEEVKKVLQEYAGDHRVIIIQQKNSGLTRALIKGCGLARADYIARIDVGDIMYPLRLRKQIDCLAADNELCLVTSWVNIITTDGDFLYCIKPDGDRLSRALRAVDVDEVKTPFHASVMFRREHYLNVGGYRAEFYFAQDVDLWLRMMAYNKLAVLDDVLTSAIFSETGISGQYRDAQYKLKNLAHACLQQRKKNLPEAGLLFEAASIKPKSQQHSEAEELKTLYFIAKCLHDNNSAEQRKYWRLILRKRPLMFKAWWFYFLSRKLEKVQ